MVGAIYGKKQYFLRCLSAKGPKKNCTRMEEQKIRASQRGGHSLGQPLLRHSRSVAKSYTNPRRRIAWGEWRRSSFCEKNML